MLTDHTVPTGVSYIMQFVIASAVWNPYREQPFGPIEGPIQLARWGFFSRFRSKVDQKLPQNDEF